MGFTKAGRGLPGMTSIALARLVIADAAASEPPKVVARKVGVSDRHIRNLAKARGAIEPGIDTALAFAQHYPQVRQFFARVLALETLDPRTEALLKSMREWQAAQPEEGDRNNG